MLIQVIAAFFVTICFSFMFNNSKSQLVYNGIVGALGWLAYLVVMKMGGTIVVASFIGSLVVSISSMVLSVYRKAPITVFQIPGIIPLVPGMGMYNTLYAVITNDYDAVMVQLFLTLQIAGAIAVGMMLIYTIRILFTNGIPATQRSL